MDYKVVLTQTALAELEEILVYFSRENPEAARNLYSALREDALSLRRFPRRHASVQGRSNVRKLPAKAFTIYYRINESKKRVAILHFWHSARRPPSV